MTLKVYISRHLYPVVKIRCNLAICNRSRLIHRRCVERRGSDSSAECCSVLSHRQMLGDISLTILQSIRREPIRASVYPPSIYSSASLTESESTLTTQMKCVDGKDQNVGGKDQTRHGPKRRADSRRIMKTSRLAAA